MCYGYHIAMKSKLPSVLSVTLNAVGSVHKLRAAKRAERGGDAFHVHSKMAAQISKQ